MDSPVTLAGLRSLLSLWRISWRTMSAVAMVGLGLGLAYYLATPPTYVAAAQLFVGVRGGTTISDLNAGTTYSEQIVQSYANVVTSPYVLESVIRESGLSETPAELAQSVSATALTDSAVLEVDVSDQNAANAAKVANLIATRLTEVAPVLTPSESDDSAGGSIVLTQIEHAVPPASPDSPRLLQCIGLGLLVGLGAAVLVVGLRAGLDLRLRSAEAVGQAFNVPVLARARYDRRLAATGLSAPTEALNGEAYRTLRNSLHFMNVDHSVKIIVISSAHEGEGKTTTASSLAIASAVAGMRVLLVDADLRRPNIANRFGIDGEIGLTNLLLGEINQDDATQAWGDTPLFIIPAGTIPPNPNELLQSQSMRDFVGTLQDRFDLVIFDSPPMLAVSDAAVVGNICDGILLVASVRKIRRPDVAKVLELLSQTRVRILGTMVTMLPEREADQYAYSYDMDRERLSARTSMRTASRAAPVQDSV